MTFKFDFKLDDEEEFPSPQTTSVPSSSSKPSYKISLDELLESLPETISYTPFTHPSLSRPLLRRDLFDARFQLINQEQQGDYVDANTDLIPGIYEGGLKTWEGGVDLVEVLAEGGFDGKSVLEVGCGTALPCCYLLQHLLSSGPGKIHLQDYNLLVLQLVTLPNLLLAALPFLSEVDDSPGHLEITDDVKQSFKSLLAQKGIELEFSHGDWAGLSKSITTYDLVLTAETIYSEESVDDLISVLKASGGVILVAAKVLYFGVGGGLGAFLQKVEQQGGHSEGVKEWTKGVGRKVVRIKF